MFHVQWDGGAIHYANNIKHGCKQICEKMREYYKLQVNEAAE